MQLRRDLPGLPRGMKTRPIDGKGYPVPFFAGQTADGNYDLRMADQEKFVACVKGNRCWVCGSPLGAHKHFVIGPMCLVNRLSSEPPSHLDCAIFSATACPHLTRPNAKRREANKPAEAKEPAGKMVRDNPGGCVIMESRNWRVKKAPGGGVLINIGDPVGEVLWYTLGRRASRAEAEALFNRSCGRLRDMTIELDGPEAVAELEPLIERARVYLPKEEAA